MSFSLPTPPVDAAGGFMLVKYTNGTDVHRMRIHLAPFTLTGWTGATQGGATVDYAYVGGTGSPTEATIAATFAALVGQAGIKGAFNSAWSFTLDQLYQVVSGVPTLVPVPPNPSVIAGNGATATGTVDRYMAQIYNFRTALGHRARLELIGAGGASALVPAKLDTSNGFIAYLTGTATGVRAHDGAQYLSPAHTSYPQMKRIRRRYGFA